MLLLLRKEELKMVDFESLLGCLSIWNEVILVTLREVSFRLNEVAFFKSLLYWVFIYLWNP
jgi:hypothetical protein